jgi:hypothetical protein
MQMLELTRAVSRTNKELNKSFPLTLFPAEDGRRSPSPCRRFKPETLQESSEQSLKNKTSSNTVPAVSIFQKKMRKVKVVRGEPVTTWSLRQSRDYICPGFFLRKDFMTQHI